MTTESYANSIRSDADWIRQAFFIPNVAVGGGRGSALRDSEAKGRRYSSAELKFTDTTPGGNFAINPRPQFTRYADPKMPGIAHSSKGMGEYYSEAIDDTARRIHLQFGVPEYNSLTNFFGRFYDHKVGRLVNTGDASEFFFFAGKALGFVLTLPLQVINGVSNFISRMFNFVNNTPYSRFYYMKATMPLYWSAVSHLATRIGVNLGLLEGPSGSDVTLSEAPSHTGVNMTYNNGLSSSEFEVMNRLLPDVMTSGQGFDVFAMSTRAQRLAAQHYKTLNKISNDNKGKGRDDFEKEVLRYINEKMDPPKARSYEVTNTDLTGLPGYLNSFYRTGKIGQGVGADDPMATMKAANEAAETSGDKAAAEAVVQTAIEMPRRWNDSDMSDYFQAELEDGGAFVTLNVANDGTIGESFSNNTRTSDVQDAFNSASSAGRSAYFSLAGGNIGEGMLAGTVEGIFKAVSQFAQGALSSVGLGGLGALGGSAYVDIPEFWESASADLPRSNYTIRLASPYGNKLSIFLNIYVPLCMLLAGALPRTTGRNSYSSPFLCSLHDQGRNIVRLGMIDSLSITRGTSNIGWSADGLPTAVDVNFSVMNLSKIMHVPVNELSGLADLAMLSMMDEDNALSDYMAVLGGVSLYDQYYIAPRLRLAWRNQMAQFERWISPTHWASHFAGTETMAGRLLGAFYRDTSRF